MEVEGQTRPFRRRGCGGGTDKSLEAYGWSWRDRQVHLGVGVEEEGQTSPFMRRGGGGGTDKSI
jgi:hypothetical protein